MLGVTLTDAKLRDRLNRLLTLAHQQNWEEESFSLQKAHICAELSSIVYEDVQEHELKKASRIHLFASDTYRSFVRAGAANSVLSALGEANLDAQFFTIRGRYALVFGAIFGDVLILTVRGTVFRKLWDWKANVDTRKFYVWGSPRFHPFEFGPVGFDDQFFHRGFFESVVPQFSSITDEIERRMSSSSNRKIVWTGHSLGGAMAAVGFAMHASRNSPLWLSKEIPGHPVSAYTFGMPRYCGLGTVCSFASPYHVYRKGDIVPTVPLRKMGFSDSSREYELTDAGSVALTERTDTFGVAGHIPHLLTSIKNHSIEGYASLLAEAAGTARP